MYAHVEWIIIDEISMVPYESLRMIHLRLGEIKNSEELFGGLNILVFGDLMQLRPVKGNWVFKQPPLYRHEPHLWRKFGFFELFKNHRQTGDTRYLDLLNRLREGHCNQGDMELLESRIFDPEVETDRELLSKFADALAIFSTNEEVDLYNQKKIEELRSRNQNLYKLNSHDTFAEGMQYGNVCPPTLIPVDVEETAGILSSMEIGVDARVMLRRNLSLTDRLVNGSIGTVVGIKWTGLRRNQLQEGDLPESIVIRFDNDMGGHRKDTNGLVHLEPVSVELVGKKNTLIRRTMFPLILCWALNCHKCQGTTLNMASIALGKAFFAKGMSYVALSCVKSLDGLSILGEILTNNVITRCNNSPASNSALREMYRLRIIKNAGELDEGEEDLERLLDWIVGYPRCRAKNILNSVCRLCNKNMFDY